MNLKEIREEAWAHAREITSIDEDRLWSTQEMNSYINRVYRHIAKETRCIRDSTTPAVCLLTSAPVDWTTYEEGTMDYIRANDEDSPLYHLDVCPYLLDLHPSIITIEDMKWVKRLNRLIKVSSEKWKSYVRWEQFIGIPSEYATDVSNNTIALNARDTASDTLQLQVRRLPLVDLIKDTDSPEFRHSYHDYFLNGVLWKMYSKQDSEAFDKDRADRHYALFLNDIDEVKQEEIMLSRKLSPNHSLSAFR